MLSIFYDMIEESVEVFMDDFSVFGNSFDTCLNNLDKMLQRCKDAHLVLNWKKCHFMVKEGIMIGHKVSSTGLEVDKAKINVISKLPPLPTSKGTENVAADHLSRIENDDSSDDSEVDDNFPGETLMEINTKNEPWFADFANNLEEPYLFKVCSDGFYWPTIIKEAHTLVRLCEACQKTGNISKRDEMPLNNIQTILLFGQENLMTLWAFRTAYKTPTGTTPYKLIYGKNCHLLFKIEHRAYWALKNCNPDLIAAGVKRMFQLHELDELRHQAYENSYLYKARTKVWHDRKLRMRKEFKQGNKVLLFHSKYKFKQPKLKSRWLGPYVVKHQYPSRYVELYGKDGKTFIVNSHRLKLYHKEDNDPREAYTKLDWAKNQKTKPSLKKTVAFTDKGNSNSDTDKIMARMDAMTLKMDALYKELMSNAKKPKLDLDEDDIPMSREEEANIMQTFWHNTKAYQPPQSRNEHVNAVFTRSGKSYNPLVNQNDQQNDSETPINFDSDDEDEEPTPQPNPKPVKETQLRKPYKLKISYPQRLRKEKMEAQYGKFLDMIRAVRINVPLIDVLAGMPNYGKFLKELISNKHKIKQISAAFLSDESSAMIQNKVPPKLGDPKSFLIPCNFNKTFSFNALVDLGASINLMPYSLYAKLSLETLRPTKMSIRLADRSFQYPKQLNLGVGTERMIFNIDSAMKHSYSNDDTCFSIDVIDEILEEDFDALLDEGSKILHSIKGTLLEEEIFAEFDEFIAMTTDENSDSESETEDPPFEKITINTDYKIKTSLEEPPTDLELKPLPDNLEYVFLEEPFFLPVIISSQLTKEKKNKLVSVLKKHKQAFAWKTTDIPGICPSFCKHKIQLLDDKKPVVQKQRRLNPNMQEVVKKEIVKLLDTGIIYPIADSPWVSPIHCVPKKGGITVVTNENDELVPTRTITGWRVCIDYRKLNEATAKDHFPLPFMDQMLERLAGNKYFCFLDGIYGYFQIPIDANDQEKTTFPCPFGTYAYRRMPFGLCNAPATFQSPNWNLPFELICDASDFVLGAVLGQKDEINDRKGTENVAADHLSRIENDDSSDDSEVDDNFPGEILMEINTKNELWFADFANYLVGDIVPKGMTYQQKNKFFSDLKHYFWEEPYLFKVCSDGMIRRCISGPETRTILDQCHHGGRHYGPNITAKKVLDSSFYWPTIIKEAHTLVRLCEACQKTGNISKRDEMPLNNIQVSEIFDIRG
ncbi:reverse transcriptase domain-containing protein [Tanacetum coccineum]